MQTTSRVRLQRLLRSRGKDAFIQSLPARARVFDIGCGNNSPERVKALRPDLHYVGLDVQDYEQTSHSVALADEYRITTPEAFPAAIRRETATMDAVISSHNLEHCSQPMDVVDAMTAALKPGGLLYLSFPCEASLHFPSRRGTLRFTDDPTHTIPPRWSDVLAALQPRMDLEFAEPRYRPVLAAVIGTMLEPLSAATRRVAPLGATWALYGFESVIWARRR